MTQKKPDSGKRQPDFHKNPGEHQQKGASPARLAALEALMDVQISDAYSGLALTRRINESALTAKDRRLMTELFYGVLENEICLDYILSKYMDRPCEDDVTKMILRMGVYQMVFMDKIPDNAIVNEAVELTRRFKRGTLSGLTNAVLRSIIRDRSRIVYPEDKVENLSVRYSFPEALVKRLMRDFGEDFTEKMLAYRSKTHTVTIRPNLTRFSAEQFEKYMTEQGFAWEKGKIPESYYISGGFVARHEGFRLGNYSIMGEGSMLAVQALGVKRGQQVLDCCAAPGGKSCYIAEKMLGTGRVYAWDLHEHRVKLISGAAQRLGLDNIRLRVQDATQIVDSNVETMDAVLVDAPCSGLGDYLSKPDIKYNITEEQISSLHAVQLEILNTCCKYVKPGGTLVYSTCTLFEEENGQTVAEFLAKHKDFELSGLDEMLPEAYKEEAKGGTLTLYPHIHGMDGFFIARMVRKKRI